MELQKKLISQFFKHNSSLLIVLDACRFDYFIHYLYLLGTDLRVTEVLSLGSCTTEWFEKTFIFPLKDVTYIAANPFLVVDSQLTARNLKQIFRRVIHLWLHGWDERLSTVRAETVNKTVKRLFIVNPRRKVIAHYLQPHAPFVSGSWLNRPYDNSIRKWIRLHACQLASKSFDARREFIRAYGENVKYVLTEVGKLIRWFKQHFPRVRIAITSDHGECLGRYAPLATFRRRVWLWAPYLLGVYRLVGHPKGKRWKELVCVPWAAVC